MLHGHGRTLHRSQYVNPRLQRGKRLTSLPQLGRDISLDIEIPPSVDDYILYAPSFTLNVESGNRPDQNTEEKLELMEAAFAAFRS